MSTVYLIRPNIEVNSAESFITLALKAGFENLGDTVYVLPHISLIPKDLAADTVVIDDLANFTQLSQLHQLRLLLQNKLAYFIWVHWPLAIEKSESIHLEVLQTCACAPHAYFFGERESCSVGNFEDLFGSYSVIPNPSPPLASHPYLDPTYVKDLTYDICFVGARYRSKSFLFDIVIPLLREKHPHLRLGLFGKGFNRRVRIANAALKGINFLPNALPGQSALKSVFSDLSRPISTHDEPYLYRQSKICLNFHESTQNHTIYNMRYFKIPYYGGFQICDSPLSSSPYFTNDEVLHIPSMNPQEWFDTISYYLTHDLEREAIRFRGTQKAWSHHSCLDRARRFKSLVHISE